MRNDLAGYLSKHPKKHLIFDFDETIFTLHLPWHIYFQEMSKRLQALKPGLAEEKSLTEYENAVVRKLGKRAAQVRWEYSEAFEREHLERVEEHRELTDFIREHADDYHFYLWTSNMRATVEDPLRQSGLLPLFTKLVTKGDVYLTKPDPEGFSLIFDTSAGHSRTEFLMVGNSAHDEMAARAAGIDFFLVTHS